MFCFYCRDVIQRIITLGFYYRELDRFATRSRNLSWIRSAKASPVVAAKTGKPSVYRRAIANGIVEILSVYRSAVLHIEQKLLAESIPILATVTQGLAKVRFQIFMLQCHCVLIIFLSVSYDQLNFASFLCFCRLCMSSYWRLSAMTFVAVSFLTFCTNDAIVGCPSCKHASKGIYTSFS